MKINITVLVFCHPRKATQSTEWHWNAECFVETIDIYCMNTFSVPYDPQIHNVIFETIDVRSGGDIVDDGFSRSFCEAHRGQYDIVYLPDCGGQWYLTQQHHQYKEFVDLLENVILLIKENGVIWASKFIRPEFKQIVYDFNDRIKKVGGTKNEKYTSYPCSCGYQTYIPITY